mgnify:CR=1 FL=1
MLTIDADAHVVECARTWDFMDKSEQQFRPVPLETREEAGVRGVPRETSLGCYVYEKRGKNGLRTVSVEVYLLEVTREFDAWPESGERTRTWFTPTAAAEAVAEPELQLILRDLEARLPR